MGGGEGDGRDGTRELTQLELEVIGVVMGATQQCGVWGIGGGDDRQLRRLPPPPVLDASTAKVCDVRLDGRRTDDVLEVTRRLLAGVED